MLEIQKKRALAQGSAIEVERVSMLTNTSSTMFIPLSRAVFQQQYDLWRAGTLIQDAFPTLSAGEREFIKTGITPEQWANAFTEED